MRTSSTNARWCPTPEQLKVLDELYRRGLRTPNAPLIQKITAHLSLYGKVQGKNVFYWFQNHKARDRQKLRKHQLQLQHQHLLHHPLPLHQYPLHFHFPSQQILPFQGSGEVPPSHSTGVMRSDIISRDCLMKRLGQDAAADDSMMISDVGPTLLPWCCSSQSPPPLQTLELFPLTSPTTAAARGPPS